MSCTGVLLVGGASRRFGSPKALAELDGETFAELAWRTLAQVCDECLAFGKVTDRLELPFEVRDDGFDVRAPIAGVVAGLRAARHEVCVFLPVDTPLVRPASLRLLSDRCRDAAIPQAGPLPGAFARSALPVLERRLAAGELALRAALTELDTVVVELDEAELVNVNEVGDLERLQAGRRR
jgi:molybdopterin-guanine dinucleotide biosynthesis protein A